jgi:signal peptidase
MVYIINPLIWLVIALVVRIVFHDKSRVLPTYNRDVITSLIVLSLLYIISYYGLGMISGYTNNPYSTTLSGIVVNLFSLWLVIVTKEYLRYVLLNIRLDRYKALYYISLFIVFFISDINLLSIMDNTDLIIIWSKELMIPFVFNLLMMYLSYVSGYKSLLITRTILVIPSLVLSVVPDYEWLIIMIFNIVFCLLSYLTIQYILSRHRQNNEVSLIGNLNPKKWIVSIVILLIFITFGLGFFTVKPVVILSGSMEPIIKPGDMVIIRKCDAGEVAVGDIVEYKMPNFNVVHRVIAITYEGGKLGFITKGDANKSPDKTIVNSNQIVGKFVLNIPYVGYPTYLIKNMVDNNEQVDIEQGGANNE